jgi:tellurite resistance protein TerA
MAISFEKQASGKVTLTKGEGRVLLRKAGEPLRATASWPPATDYDVYALVVLRDGSTRAVAMFGADGQPPQASYGGVRHLGDVGRSTRSGGGGGLKGLFRKKPAEQPPATATETVEIVLDDSVAAVVPVVYSAQSNGTGSFRRYQVSTTVTNGADSVTIEARDANDADDVYSLVPAVIYHHPDGAVVERVERYSEPGSERRPAVVLGADGSVTVQMDRGPENDFK